MKNSKIWKFGNFFKFGTLTLSCAHVLWMLEIDSSSEFVLFHLMFVVASKIKLIPRLIFLLQSAHFEWLEIRHADVSLRTE